MYSILELYQRNYMFDKKEVLVIGEAYLHEYVMALRASEMFNVIRIATKNGISYISELKSTCDCIVFDLNVRHGSSPNKSVFERIQQLFPKTSFCLIGGEAIYSPTENHGLILLPELSRVSPQKLVQVIQEHLAVAQN
jgi:hypothetical protein